MKEKTLENDLITSDFKKIEVSSEESGEEYFYYYIYEFGEGINTSLISCDNHEAEKQGFWSVEIFDDPKIKFENYQDWLKFIYIVKKAILYNEQSYI